ncbi:glycosyltransferase family protein [Williamsia deligens]|uniref:Glycosyltransferase family 2 protein n=1 Tax=Williamsia deligens TaxID=321325 RepID=A0ABW3G3Y5_9NOCA|nr:glycosyltransferase family 2 protein [Williamsia deligens]MCP2193971.1 Glycosyltransferase, GT2 family [Williamsia deligens]
MSLFVGIPVYGQVEMTHDLIADLEREDVDYVIVDNKGDYYRAADETVVRPGRNLGWAGGSNLAIRMGFADGYDWAMTLNNDVRLSRGFGTGVTVPGLPEDAGVVAPVYDDRAHLAVLSDYRGPAEDYEPQPVYRVTPIVDGTAMAISRDAWRDIGELDERTFGSYAWGANLDLCLRARDAGYGVYGTETSFINHLGRRTVREMDSRYVRRAMKVMTRAMKSLYGTNWRATAFPPVIERRELGTHRVVDPLVREPGQHG